MRVIPHIWLSLYFREQSHGYSFLTTSVPPITLLELPFTPQSGKSDRTLLGLNVVVVVDDNSWSSSSFVRCVVVEELFSLFLPGKMEGQRAAPIAPIAIPTGKAIASSCLVLLVNTVPCAISSCLFSRVKTLEVIFSSKPASFFLDNTLLSIIPASLSVS